jgi:hypothetical protein
MSSYIGLALGIMLLSPTLQSLPGRARSVTRMQNRVIAIEYGRPELQNRRVEDLIVPNIVWRLGADMPTTLYTEAALVFGDNRLSAGSYTLLAQYDGSAWSLIFNSDSELASPNQRDLQKDILRVGMREVATRNSVDVLTINIEQTHSANGIISVAWGTRKLTVPFAIAK